MTLSVLLVEDNALHARVVGAALAAPIGGGSWDLRRVDSLAAAVAVTEPPDVILLDLTLPDGDGLDALARVRERFPAVPVVLLTATEDASVEAGAVEAGAQDLLGKDELTPRALRRVIRYAVERHRAQLELVRLSTRDELTGLYNRRGFFAAAEHQLRLAARGGRPLLLLYADLDGLKTVNDTLGHAAGDAAIQDAAWVLRHTFRAADIVARLGGDEFAVLVADANPEAAELVLARLASWQARLNAEPGRTFAISLSAGTASAASTHADAGALESLLAAADAAAYEQKRARGLARRR